MTIAACGGGDDRLIELVEITDRLTRVMGAEYMVIRLSRPLNALDDDKPIERLAQGDYRSIAQLIGEIEYGVT